MSTLSALPRRLLLILMACGLAACATTSVFQPYPGQAQHWKRALRHDNLGAVLEPLKAGAASADRLLYLQEQARLHQLAGHYRKSLALYKRVFHLYEQQDAQALFELSEAGANLAALLTNDNAIPYSGFPYERIYAHGFQALNYLALGNVEGAAVEWRRAALEQAIAAREHHELIAEARKRAARHDINLRHYEHQFPLLSQAAAQVKGSINNAWVFYLAGAFFEGIGAYNRARVDYVKALQMHPDSDMIRADIQRVQAKMQGRLESQLGLVVVSYVQGFVAPRSGVQVSIPVGKGIITTAFPTYDVSDFTTPEPLKVTVAGRTRKTMVFTHTAAMAARALKARMPAIVVRQVLRTTVKYRLTRQAYEELGALGGIMATLYSVASERADLRSWLTLPAYAQATRIRLSPGVHRMTLSANSDSATVSVPVHAGDTTFVRVVDPGSELRVQVLPIQESYR